MIAVSQTYNPYTIVRDVDMVVTLDAINESAANYATYSATYKQSITNLNQINTREFVDVNYATCENGLTKLDGTWHYLDTVITTQHIGWWTNILSNSEGVFTTIPTFTATLSRDEDVVGFTLHFANSNPVKKCQVTTYNGSDMIYSEEFTSNTASMVIDLPASDFDRVEVGILETEKPYRRVKLSNFVFGITKRWTRDNILNASITEEADITGNTLPINELSVEFDNTTGEFDVIGDTKTYVYRTASNKANITATNQHEVSNLNQLRDNTLKAYNYATCENYFVELRGQHHYLPPATIPSSYQIGYVNNTVSNTSSQYNTIPQVTYTWTSDTVTSSGLRLYFGERNYATSITASAYINNTLIDSVTITNNEDSVVEFDFAVNGYNKLILSFPKSVAPYRLLKLHEIQILKYADSWYSYLNKNQHLEAFFVINGEQVNMGKTYMFDKLEQTNNGLTAKIVAKDYVNQFNEQVYDGSNGTTSLSTLLSNILSGSGVSTKYPSGSALPYTTVNMNTPKDTTKRAALHYACQAAKATCTMTRDGDLYVTPFATSNYVDTITLNELYSKDIARMSDYVNMIRLTVKNEYVDPETQNVYFGGSGLYYREIQNNCVASTNGQAVANWLLEQAERRIFFEMKTRGNPAIELGDTVKIITQDGTSYLAVVYYQEFVYGKGLSCIMKAVV